MSDQLTLTQAQVWYAIGKDFTHQDEPFIANNDVREKLKRASLTVAPAGYNGTIWTFRDGSQIFSNARCTKIVGTYPDTYPVATEDPAPTVNTEDAPWPMPTPLMPLLCRMTLNAWKMWWRW